jgi:two-component system nitrate/nitrite response regulator NarL
MAQSQDALTPREMDVLQLLALGLHNKHIAARLHVNERTIKYHVSAILSKLEVSNRTEAVTEAARRKWISLEEEQA